MKPNRSLAIALAATALSITALAADAPSKKKPEKAVAAKPAAKPAANKIGLQDYPSMGSIQRLDPRLDAILAKDAHIEKLADGFDWSEGPVWIKDGRYLLFSDVPQNLVYSWSEGKPATVFMKHSGYTGSKPRGGEPGSNGLTTDAQGRLVLCEHGDRRVSRLEVNGKKTTLAQYYRFYRFNSPNDLVYHSNGDLYFTDPPYGLVDRKADSELPYSGVYRLKPGGEVALLTEDLPFPNGIAFSPDEKILYVAVSDPDKPIIAAFDVKKDGTVENQRTFFDASALLKQGLKGLPDGLKVDRKGNVFATAPGGVLILAPDGAHLGTIATGEATANCNWGNDGSVLYITADMYLCRVRTLTKGKGW
ncbi:MAG: SMP-30/gluconolactonase/LRE family protein [Verrucomicrobia bacterium]|nr:SMP-30/gluconolactonase/LRE family protein [Verrucomicrobiota bacterium]MBI3869048.1 SMP-30/gluconolactonase/LRE family protein [Verrucomicrobiota bacterium]